MWHRLPVTAVIQSEFGNPCQHSQKGICVCLCTCIHLHINMCLCIYTHKYVGIMEQHYHRSQIHESILNIWKTYWKTIDINKRSCFGHLWQNMWKSIAILHFINGQYIIQDCFGCTWLKSFWKKLGKIDCFGRTFSSPRDL